MREDTSSDGEPRTSPAKRLIAAITSLDAELFHDQQKRAFCVTPAGGVQLIHSADFADFAAGQYFRAYQSVIAQKALQDALATLSGMARYEAEQQTVFVRVAQHEGRHVIDLGDVERRCVAVDAGGWRIEPHPVRFWRPEGMLPLPEPVPGGDVRQLLELVRIEKCRLPLLVTWMLEAWRFGTPKKVIEFAGEYGASKSSAQRVAVSLVDPHRIELQMTPGTPRDLAAAAGSRWLLSFDNASHLVPEMQDQLCVIATGGTLAERRLYSNFGQASVAVLNPVALNGIGGAVTRPDLLSRTLLIELREVGPNERLTDTEFRRRLHAARPALLGALLDLFAKALELLPDVHLADKPRMADFAQLGEAVTTALDWPVPFSELYAANRKEADARVLDQYSIAQAILQLLAQTKDHCWQGYYAELHKRLLKPEGVSYRSWPETPKGLSSVVARIAPNLRGLGVLVTRPPRDSRGQQIFLDGRRATELLEEYR